MLLEEPNRDNYKNIEPNRDNYKNIYNSLNHEISLNNNI